MHRKICKVFAAIILLWVGCSDNNYVSTILSQAESVLQESPDSALHIMDGINPAVIPSDKQMADYAYLYTKAQYKAYKDAKNDSLIQLAVDYYKAHNENAKLAESLMLRGSIETANKQYSDAMITLQQAAEVGEGIADNFLLGQIYSNLYDVCQYGYNADQVQFAEKALEYYHKTKDEYYIIDAKSNLARAYLRIKEFDKCNTLLDEVIKQAESTADTFSLLKAIPDLALIKAENKDFKAADSLLNILRSGYNYKFTSVDNWAIAENMLSNGDRDSAIELMDSASKIRMSLSTELQFNAVAGHFYSQIGDYKRAYQIINRFDILKDSVSNERYKGTVMSAQRDYVVEKLVLQEIKESRNLYLSITSIVSILAVLAFVVFYYNRRLKIRSMEMENLMLQISDMEQIVTTKDTTISGLNDQIQTVKDETILTKDKVKQLYDQKYQQLNSLCISYFNGQNSLFAKNAIYREVQKIIEGFVSDDKAFRELEAMTNSVNDGILNKLKKELPQIKESDYRFFCYIFAGFSSRSISLLMQENIDTVYQHRSRWKKRIESMDIPSKALFLKFL